jgi:hypothetical protein
MSRVASGQAATAVAPTVLLPADIAQVRTALDAFVAWLDSYGETSFDHQTYFAGPTGRAAKALYYKNRALGTLAVAPMIASEAFLPAARRLFWKRQRLPISDAHYSMGFAFLALGPDRQRHYERAVHFLRVLIDTRSPGVRHAWGYPFDWVTKTGIIDSGTPMITTVPYVYEAFEQVYQLDAKNEWLEIMRSIAEHAFRDYLEYSTGPEAASCSYTPPPVENEGVINASAYRGSMLMKAASQFNIPEYRDAAQRNLNFVLQSQNPNGSWPYALDQQRDFVDHFHTCFVLKALAKVEDLTRDQRYAGAIARGVDYYVRHLFDGDRLPQPFSQRPRMTVYRRELYDYAECVNLGVLLKGRFPELDATVTAVVRDLMKRWTKSDGSFRGRQLYLGWDNVPMHRWAQSQMFRSLSFLVSQSASH